MRLSVLIVAVVSFLFFSPGNADPSKSTIQPLLTEQEVTPSKKRAKNTCVSARKALAFYRLRYASWRELRGVKTRPRIHQPHGCAHVRWSVKKARERSTAARKSYYLWHEWQKKFLLRDTGDWRFAVREVQRPFPGTDGWLLSCSDAESNHTDWVGHGGRPYSAWLRDSDTVGGYMQFRFSTFKGMFHQGYDYAIARGFRFPYLLKRSSYRSEFEWKDEAWQTALGQAIAAGWARYTGEDNSHWSASWGNGC